MTDGSLDDTFGDGGITISDFTGFGCAQADLNAMAIQSDGKLVASGFTACKGDERRRVRLRVSTL